MLAGISVPLSLWWGTRDDRGRDHAAWLAAAVPHAEPHGYPGGHVQPADSWGQTLRWLGRTVVA